MTGYKNRLTLDVSLEMKGGGLEVIKLFILIYEATLRLL